MRYLGIDFGLKRIGVAYSDETEGFALPLAVISNTKHAVDDVIAFAQQKLVEAFVVGESKNYSGDENPIMKNIKVFAQLLESKSGLPIYFEPEFMTSAHVEKLQGKHDLSDASAAALILQSFLERKKNGGLG